jgi:hypothetical protein
MRFTELLTNLISEQSRFEVLYDKIVKPQGKPDKGEKKPTGHMDFNTFKEIIFADPTTIVPEGFNKETATEKDMSSVKIGKYVQWLIKNFVTPKPSDFEFEGERDPKNPKYKKARQEFERLFLEDLYKQTERLQYYERAKQYLPQEQRDINRLGVNDLFDIFANFKLPEKKVKDIEKKDAKKTREGFKHAGGEIIHQGPKWTVIKISDKGETGKDAAIYYGGFKEHQQGESDWCTASPGLTFFNNYIKDGPLFVVFPNDDKGEVGNKTGLPKERYQFHFPSSQFMNRDDRQIDLVGMLNGEMSEIKDLFKKDFANGLVTKGGEHVNIEYPKSASGKFVALYGFDELFESLPDDITMLNISNTSDKPVELDVPDSVGRFKQLKTLEFKNIIKSLSDRIGELTNLEILSIPENKNLKSLPDSILNIKNLSFINLENSNPNIQIPEKLKSAMQVTKRNLYFLDITD